MEEEADEVVGWKKKTGLHTVDGEGHELCIQKDARRREKTERSPEYLGVQPGEREVLGAQGTLLCLEGVGPDQLLVHGRGFGIRRYSRLGSCKTL